MNFNNFTIKSQEAVQQAIQMVQNRGQQAIEAEHMLAGVLKVGENVTNFLFQKLGLNGTQINNVLDKHISSLPKVSGGEPYLSRTANEVLQKAIEFSKGMGDEYVSLEALLLALLNVKSTASTILKDAGMNEKDLRSAINELRQKSKEERTRYNELVEKFKTTTNKEEKAKIKQEVTSICRRVKAYDELYVCAKVRISELQKTATIIKK